jgi:Reverse transcriptase (RNA-dependent DNA polymerase)
MPTRNTPEEGNYGIIEDTGNQVNTGEKPRAERVREQLEANEDFQNFIQQPQDAIPDIPEEAFDNLSHEEVNELLETLEEDEFENEVSLILADKFDIALLALGNKEDPTTYKDTYEPPATFKQAWDHQDPWKRERWREANSKELKKMEDLKVWKVVKKTTVPQGRRCVKHKWVFLHQENFRARLVACGYSQIPGIDFTEIYSPVVNDVALRIMDINEIVWRMKAMIIDIETAFLYGELEETIFMECPKGINGKDDECVLLKKSLYGLVHNAKPFFRKLIQVLTKIGFTQSNAEPCLLIKKGILGIVVIAIHVDDCYTIGGMRHYKKSFSLLRRIV